MQEPTVVEGEIIDEAAEEKAKQTSPSVLGDYKEPLHEIIDGTDRAADKIGQLTGADVSKIKSVTEQARVGLQAVEEIGGGVVKVAKKVEQSLGGWLNVSRPIIRR